MADLKYYDIILKPVVTEKSMDEMADKKYAFYVHPKATKNQVKEAIEKLFDGAKVEKVNTMNMSGKKKRTRSFKYGTTAARKKAIVKLKPESKDIEIFQGM
jgi:large subunit ribosomal protein L23